MNEGAEETNQRTGHKTRSLPGMTFEIENEFPLLTLRQIPIRVFVAEQIWFISGSRRPEEFLRDHTAIWDDFTNINGVVTAAYGYRYRHYFGRDQLGKLISLLEEDPSSRHGVVSAWDPANDGLEAKQIRKNVPCPFVFVVNIIDDALNLHNIVRSNDMILGCPHDAAGFALLQRFLAARLGCKVGKYTHSISHAHIYDVHYEAAEELTTRKTSHPPIDIKLRKNDISLAEKHSERLFERISDDLASQYSPQPSIKGLPIVL
jgi:thymidylate synthase